MGVGCIAPNNQLVLYVEMLYTATITNQFHIHIYPYPLFSSPVYGAVQAYSESLNEELMRIKLFIQYTEADPEGGEGGSSPGQILNP